MKNHLAPLERVLYIVGGVCNLARILRISQPSVSQWRLRGDIPVDRCAAVEDYTGIPCEELRPDIEFVRGDDGVVTGYVVPVPPELAAHI